MVRTLLMMAVVAGGCAAAPAQEKGMKLELQTTVEKEKKQTLVTAILRNTGSEPVNILKEYMLSRTYGKLADEGGKELKPHDASAVQGARAFGLVPIKTHRLKPGEEVQVGQFSINPSVGHAITGDFTWDLKEVKSKTLTLEMIYEVTPDAANIAKENNAPDVAIGKWTSKPVVLDFRK